MEFQPSGRGQLLHRDAVISNDLDVLDQRLSSLLNVEYNIDLRIVNHDLGRDLGVFISSIAIQRLDIVRALMRQLLAHTSVRPEPEISLLDAHHINKILLSYPSISLKHIPPHFCLL